MQRENFYNLHKTGYFIVALFVFKKDKTLVYRISTVQTSDAFWYKMNLSFLISSFYNFSFVNRTAFHGVFRGVSYFIFNKTCQVIRRSNKKNELILYQKKSFLQSQNLIAQSLSILEIKSPTIK